MASFLPTGSPTLCRYDLLQMFDENHGTVQGHHISGVGLGPRMVIALVGACRQIAGEDALKELKLIIHIMAEQEQFLMSDFVAHDFYGLTPENVLVILQVRLRC